MATVSEFNRLGEEIEKLMLLRTSPLAVKMLEKESDIPEGAIRPKADQGYHLAQCQAFSISRRKGESVAMLKDDNWCWGPLIACGLVDQGISEKFPELKDVVKKIPLSSSASVDWNRTMSRPGPLAESAPVNAEQGENE